jgi:uncharacterized protein
MEAYALAAVYNRAYTVAMQFEWDERKASSNVRKHGIHFADAVAVFEDDAALTIPDEFPREERFVTIGTDAFGRVLVVVYTYRGEQGICLISARKATARERRQYEGEI